MEVYNYFSRPCPIAWLPVVNLLRLHIVFGFLCLLLWRNYYIWWSCKITSVNSLCLFKFNSLTSHKLIRILNVIFRSWLDSLLYQEAWYMESLRLYFLLVDYTYRWFWLNQGLKLFFSQMWFSSRVVFLALHHNTNFLLTVRINSFFLYFLAFHGVTDIILREIPR